GARGADPRHDRAPGADHDQPDLDRAGGRRDRARRPAGQRRRDGARVHRAPAADGRGARHDPGGTPRAAAGRVLRLPGRERVLRAARPRRRRRERNRSLHVPAAPRGGRERARRGLRRTGARPLLVCRGARAARGGPGARQAGAGRAALAARTPPTKKATAARPSPFLAESVGRAAYFLMPCMVARSAFSAAASARADAASTRLAADSARLAASSARVAACSARVAVPLSSCAHPAPITVTSIRLATLAPIDRKRIPLPPCCWSPQPGGRKKRPPLVTKGVAEQGD